jgi:YHS domain-containing protein
MLGRLFFLALLAMFFYFMLRSFFLPIRKPGKAPVFKEKHPEPDTEMARDPECGVYIDPRKALVFETGGVTYYFCCEQCLKKFQAKLKQGGTA